MVDDYIDDEDDVGQPVVCPFKSFAGVTATLASPHSFQRQALKKEAELRCSSGLGPRPDLLGDRQPASLAQPSGSSRQGPHMVGT